MANLIGYSNLGSARRLLRKLAAHDLTTQDGRLWRVAENLEDALAAAGYALKLEGRTKQVQERHRQERDQYDERRCVRIEAEAKAAESAKGADRALVVDINTGEILEPVQTAQSA